MEENKELNLLIKLQEKLTKDKKILIQFKVSPGSKKNELIEIMSDQITYKIKIKAIPENNKANIELINFLSQKLKIKKDNIIIKSGHSNSIKKIEINL